MGKFIKIVILALFLAFSININATRTLVHNWSEANYKFTLPFDREIKLTVQIENFASSKKFTEIEIRNGKNTYQIPSNVFSDLEHISTDSIQIRTSSYRANDKNVPRVDFAIVFNYGVNSEHTSHIGIKDSKPYYRVLSTKDSEGVLKHTQKYY